MKLAVLYSGGKDSTFAMMEAMKEGHEIVCLVTIFPKRDDSYMFHFPCIELTRLQAEAMEIRHVTARSSGEKERELEDLRNVLSGLKENGEIEGVVSGAVSSEYQRKRIGSICDELGLKSLVPIWGREAYDVLWEEIDAGLEIIVVGVATGSLDESWLGRNIDMKVVEELKLLSEKKNFNIQFEGGEAESFVVDCPLFRKRILIEDFEKVWEEETSSGHIVVRKAFLEPKQI